MDVTNLQVQDLHVRRQSSSFLTDCSSDIERGESLAEAFCKTCVRRLLFMHVLHAWFLSLTLFWKSRVCTGVGRKGCAMIGAADYDRHGGLLRSGHDRPRGGLLRADVLS